MLCVCWAWSRDLCVYFWKMSRLLGFTRRYLWWRYIPAYVGSLPRYNAGIFCTTHKFRTKTFFDCMFWLFDWSISGEPWVHRVVLNVIYNNGTFCSFRIKCNILTISLLNKELLEILIFYAKLVNRHWWGFKLIFL